MKVSCKSCNKTLNVPDEKIPADRPLTFKCPGCQNPVIVDKSGNVKALDETHNVQLPAGGIPEDTANLSALLESMESEMDMLEEGSKRALVADEKHFEIFNKLLKKLGYTVSKVENAKDGLDKMEVNEYEVVILNEGFGGAAPDRNPLHMLLEQMNMDRRRKIFVVLIGKSLKSLDNMTAFIKSVNMVVSESDLGNIELMFKKSLSEHEVFYHVFNRMMIETGREVEL